MGFIAAELRPQTRTRRLPFGVHGVLARLLEHASVTLMVERVEHGERIATARQKLGRAPDHVALVVAERRGVLKVGGDPTRRLEARCVRTVQFGEQLGDHRPSVPQSSAHEARRHCALLAGRNSVASAAGAAHSAFDEIVDGDRRTTAPKASTKSCRFAGDSGASERSAKRASPSWKSHRIALASPGTVSTPG